MENYKAVLKKYAVFGGRASRKEYWMFILFQIIIGIILGVLDGLLGWGGGRHSLGILSIIYSLATLIPGLAVSVRRLHDTNRTGWWLLLSLIPFFGFIVLLIFMCEHSTPGTNEYGLNPHEEHNSEPIPKPSDSPLPTPDIPSV